MLIITLLGTGNYQKTTYEWKENDKTCAYTTEFFPEAIAHFFQPDKIMALVTSQAKAHANFKNFCDRLPGLIEAIDIPEGKSEQDLWAIFDKCAAAIDEKETIILDITHAFRSLPLYVFTVAAYLRRTKGVKIKHIVYGAYEARDERNHSPTLDLRCPGRSEYMYKRYELEVLTPLAIGSGSKISPLEYLINNGKFIRVDMDKFFHDKRFDPNKFIQQAEAGRLDFARNWPFAADHPLYVLSGDKHTLDGLAPGRSEVHEFVREAAGWMVPGSSLKGALRTWTYQAAMTKDDHQKWLEKIEEKAADAKRKKEEAATKAEHAVSGTPNYSAFRALRLGALQQLIPQIWLFMRHGCCRSARTAAMAGAP
ncbi:type III-A CRISPR-associated RAMP protein Csm5 [Sporolituus thermophilus]|uniref:CRISPR system Cms protein Csm5 n=1 Tax=Sporolituus thermophilus DSM 23256 TaxID=1123285 RepID=A0A1G7HLK2_9FIRM|nr:type III-A CRISPR-associated RAMP protein Csm5 [Sporolituus thermophilus]SDF01243.1 CRISPR type III-A/MTUBE-associated RAMP protein Csm5 [Sporolituus thermophilus DSM 23256]